MLLKGGYYMKYESILDFVVNGNGKPLVKSHGVDLYHSEEYVMIYERFRNDVVIFSKEDKLAVEKTAVAIINETENMFFCDRDFILDLFTHQVDPEDYFFDDYLNTINFIQSTKLDSLTTEFFINMDSLESIKESPHDFAVVPVEYVLADYIQESNQGGIVLLDADRINEFNSAENKILYIQNLVDTHSKNIEDRVDLSDCGSVIEEHVSLLSITDALTVFIENEEWEDYVEADEIVANQTIEMSQRIDGNVLEFGYDPELSDYTGAFYKGLLEELRYDPKYTFHERTVFRLLGEHTSYESLTSWARLNEMDISVEIERRVLEHLGNHKWSTVHFVAAQSNFDEILPEKSRVFITNSQEKIFNSGLGGYSMYSNAVDTETWPHRSGFQRMEHAKIDKFFFTQDDLKSVDMIALHNTIKRNNPVKPTQTLKV